MKVQDTKAWVVGLARSGCAAGALLRGHGAHVVGIDESSSEVLSERWEREGLGRSALDTFDEIHDGDASGGPWAAAQSSGGPDLVVLSPGVPTDHAALKRLPASVEIIGEMELGARFCRAPLVAVTGTNGKSTTTELIAHLYRKAGRKARALGNLGQPLCTVADQMTPDEVAVLEVSSFQLETVREFRPSISVVLNLAPDHLDRYPDLNAYFAAKRVLAERTAPGGDFITWTGCRQARGWETAGRKRLFGDRDQGAEVYIQDRMLCWDKGSGSVELIAAADLAQPSPPNLLNALAAADVALAAGLDPKAVREGLADFPGLAHRHQLVGVRGGVRFVNDTKATNVHAVCAGLDGYPSPVVLILGGSGKGEDYEPLAAVMASVKHVVLIGQEGPAIGKVLAGVVPTHSAGSMDEAVAVANDLAVAGTTILLSPACASFDMFASYRARGEAFVKAARELGATMATEETA